MELYHAWDFETVLLNWNVLGRGLVRTIHLAVVILASGLTLGLFVGAARYSRRRLLNWPATAFIEVFRNTPALVQIMWFYFAFPILVSVDFSAFAAATTALSLNTAAFSAEIFRGGIQSISRTQWDAGRALGMTYVELMRRVVLPQAIKRMVPAFTNRGIEVTKMTSLASVIAFPEMLHEARTLSATHFNPIEAFTSVAFIFLVILYIAVQFTYKLEDRLRRSD